MKDRDPNIIHSGLSGLKKADGISYEVCIYRLEHIPGWALEVKLPDGGSVVWDGTFEGTPVPPGVYYFVMSCSDAQFSQSGSIMLAR